MDPLEVLTVRFHFGGKFDYDGHSLNYVHGRVGLSHIDRDKLSLPELRGFLCDHVSLTIEDVVDFHWLSPGADMNNGVRMLADDQSCRYMSDCVTMGGVAEVYVEIYKSVGGQLVMWTCEGENNAIILGSIIEDQMINPENVANTIYNDESTEDDDIDEEGGSESEDSDYQQWNEDTSEHDEEANEFMVNAMNQRKNPAITIATSQKVLIHESDKEYRFLDSNDPQIMDSSEEASYEDDDDDAEGIRRKSRFVRYDSEVVIPKFCVGMTFSGRVEFKQALIKYGLSTQRHLSFPKDEKDRIRAKCSWKGCPWFIFASRKTNIDRFQVKTFIDEHICPKRKDNRFVTGVRIADKYEHIIKANPSWKLLNIKETVLLDMGVDVSVSKVKRAKAIVMRRIYESCKGEYAKIFRYQAEILRSNPGSTVAVYLDPDYTELVFQRFYVCFDACKRGFLAGCRKVIGVDGCFFKGACNGELLCALGRDANNQIYPIAWAIVEKETEDSWSWFLGLLQKDLQVTLGGRGWVIISDQQKVNDLFHDQLVVCL